MKALIPFLKLFKKQAWWIILGTVLSLLTILASIGLLSLSGWFISATAFVAGVPALALTFNFFLPAVGVRFFSLMRIINRYGERLISHEATFKVLTDIRVWFYQKLEPLAPAHLLKFRSGDLLTRIVLDVDALDSLYIRIIAPTIIVIIATVFVGFFFSFFSIKIALITVLIMLFTACFVPFLSGMLAKKTGQNIAEVNGTLKTDIIENIQGMAELKVFGANEKHLAKINEDNAKLIKFQHKMSIYQGLGSACISLLMGLTLWIVVWIATSLVEHNKLNGAFIALLALAVMALFEAVMPLPLAYQYLGKTIASAKRLLYIVNHKPQIQFVDDTDEAIIKDNYHINFKNVSFSYSSRGQVINNICLDIPYKQKLAIVGATGSGKTTLIQLLSRFWDINKGEISIAGIDIKKFPESQLRKLMTIIPQKPYIFNSSIKENLLIANQKATESELWEALDKVQLADFIKTLPKGLDTWTGDNGKQLSGGQQKRLALARVILRDAPILILDEPTEGLDKITERKVFKALNEVMINKTVILITHNRNLLIKMDKVVEIINGTVTKAPSAS